MNKAAVHLCASQDTRRARADRSQGEGQATASPDDDEDNADDSEGQIDDKKHVLISKQLMPSHDQPNFFWTNLSEGRAIPRAGCMFEPLQLLFMRSCLKKTTVTLYINTLRTACAFS